VYRSLEHARVGGDRNIARQEKNLTIMLVCKYQIVQQEQSGAYAELPLRDVSSGWILGALLSF
jgi:hypothetical protein